MSLQDASAAQRAEQAPNNRVQTLQSAALTGDADAQFNLDCCMQEDEVSKDSAMAMDLFRNLLLRVMQQQSFSGVMHAKGEG